MYISSLALCSKARLLKLMKEIKDLYGLDYHIYVIEFQKCGLLHAHIVIKVSDSNVAQMSYFSLNYLQSYAATSG